MGHSGQIPGIFDRPGYFIPPLIRVGGRCSQEAADGDIWAPESSALLGGKEQGREVELMIAKAQPLPCLRLVILRLGRPTVWRLGRAPGPFVL
jgi:hypothetical protein